MGTQAILEASTVEDLLGEIEKDDERKVLEAIVKSVAEIAGLLRDGGFGSLKKGGDTNVFGDSQLKIDVEADNVIRDHMQRTGVVGIVSSEERPEELKLNDNAPLCVAYDPLDGSSVVGCNFAVGSIFGVWRRPSFIGACGRDVVISVAAVYGPRTTLYVYTSSTNGRHGSSSTAYSGVHEITLTSHEKVLKGAVQFVGPISDNKGKLFAPANLRASQDLPGYARLVNYYLEHRYTLRYTGAMVPDVTQLLVKGHGVFVSPVSEKAPAKLRLLYEAIPMAALIEAAGGLSSDGSSSILDLSVNHCEERTGICLGGSVEVKRFEDFCRI